MLEFNIFNQTQDGMKLINDTKNLKMLLRSLNATLFVIGFRCGFV